MPNRNIDSTVSYPATLQRNWSDGRKFTITTVDKTVTLKWISSVTPNFWQLRKQKAHIPPLAIYKVLDVTRPLRGTGIYTDTAPGMADSDEFGVFNGTFSQVGPLLGIESIDWVDLDQRAVERVRSAIKSSSINLAVTFGERKQTADLIYKTAKSIALALTRLRKFDLLGAASALGVLPTKTVLHHHRVFEPYRRRRKVFDFRRQEKELYNAWLSLKYGWGPLLNDVYGAAEHAAKVRRPQHRISSAFSDTKTGTLTEDSTYWRKISNSEVKATVRYTVRYRIDDDAMKEFSELGILNPAAVAWELMPLSFVWDWFVPISNWISNWDALVGVTVLSVYKTEITRGTVYTVSSGKRSGTITYTSNCRGDRQYFRINGAPLTTLPALPIPSFRNPFSASHVVSAISLIGQRVR